MLESDASKILGVSTMTVGFGTDIVATAKGGKTPTVAFAAELSRAQEVVGEKTTTVNTKAVANAEIDNPLNTGAVVKLPADTNGSSVLSTGLDTTTSSSLQKVSGLPEEGVDLKTALSGEQFGVTEAESLTLVSPGSTVTDSALPVTLSAAKPAQASMATISVEGQTLSPDVIESVSTVNEVSSLLDQKVGLADVGEPVPSVPNGLTPSSGLTVVDSVAASLSAPLTTNSILVKNPTSVKVDSTVDPTLASLSGKDETTSGTVTAAEPGVKTLGVTGAATASATIAATLVPTSTLAGASAAEVVAKSTVVLEGATSNNKLAIGVSGETTKPGAQEVRNKIVGDQLLASPLEYKPSPALVKSGLGRLSVALNNGVRTVSPATGTNVVNASTQTAESIPSLVSTSVTTAAPASSLAMPNTIPQSITEVGPATIILDPKAPSAIGNSPIKPGQLKSTNLNQSAGAATTLSDIKPGVTYQAAPNNVTVIEPSNTTTDTTLAELAVVKNSLNTANAETSEPSVASSASLVRALSADSLGGNSKDGGNTRHQQQLLAVDGGKVAVDKDAVLAQQVEITALEQKKKVAEVTPGITARQADKLSFKAELPRLSATNTPLEVTTNNVYHATTSGIITANSTALNTAMPGELTMAPRTVFLEQPGADQSLVDNLRWAVNEKLSRATINVTPANLGPITVSVDLESQNMSVSILTNNTVAKEAIDNLMPRIKEHFSNEGYQQVSVDVSSQQDRGSNLRNQSENSFGQEGGAEIDNAYGTDSVQEGNAQASDNKRVSTSLIDTYA